MAVVNWIATNIFGNAGFLLGIIVMLGLILQKKSFSQTVQGTIKAIIGFQIIGIGSGIVVSSLNVFQPMWAEVFGLEAQSLGKYMGQNDFVQRFGTVVTLSMTFGFLINVLLARITKFKYIYLTGHMMFWTSLIFAGIIFDQNINANTFAVTAFLSIVLGIYWTLQPALTQPFLRKITGNDSVALGHTSASVAFLGAVAGKFVGNKDKSTEDLVISEKWGFLRDSNIVTGITMAVLFIIGTVLLMIKNTEGAREILVTSGDTSFIIYSILTSLQFAGGIAVVLFGVRMFIGEMVPAFKGIATKIVPGAIPALDAPIVYPYAPNAVIIGFLGAFVASLIWLVVLGNTVGYVFVPTMIAIFFHAGTAGVFGNKTGGIRGALFAGVITATVIAIGQYVMVTFLAPTTVPDVVMWAADSDMFIIGPIIRLIAGFLF